MGSYFFEGAGVALVLLRQLDEPLRDPRVHVGFGVAFFVGFFTVGFFEAEELAFGVALAVAFAVAFGVALVVAFAVAFGVAFVPG